MDIKLRVLDYIVVYGPVLPVQVSKTIGRDIIFSSAILAELVSDKKAIISNVKVGGSPVYYVSGQEIKLQRFSNNLGEKPKKMFEILREKKVVRDNELEPWQRVASREIKDFAIPLRVKDNDVDEIFWKWYLLPNEEAEVLVKELLGIKRDIKNEEVEKLEELDEIKIEPDKVKVKKKIVRKLSSKEEIYNKYKDYLNKNNIKILSEEISKRKIEYGFIANIPSKLGDLRYFVYVKDKKNINEGDLSLAYYEGQVKKLPVLFLSEGELTKRAKEYLDKNLKGYLVFKNIK